MVSADGRSILALQSDSRAIDGALLALLFDAAAADRKRVAVEAQCTHIVTLNIRDFVGIEQFGLQAITPGQFLALLGDPS